MFVCMYVQYAYLIKRNLIKVFPYRGSLPLFCWLQRNDKQMYQISYTITTTFIHVLADLTHHIYCFYLL